MGLHMDQMCLKKVIKGLQNSQLVGYGHFTKVRRSIILFLNEIYKVEKSRLLTRRRNVTELLLKTRQTPSQPKVIDSILSVTWIQFC